MSEDPHIPPTPEPADPSPPEAGAPAPSGLDYVAEIRRALIEEDQQQQELNTGSLLLRLGSSLRRVTGRLGKRGPEEGPAGSERADSQPLPEGVAEAAAEAGAEAGVPGAAEAGENAAVQTPMEMDAAALDAAGQSSGPFVDGQTEPIQSGWPDWMSSIRQEPPSAEPTGAVGDAAARPDELDDPTGGHEAGEEMEDDTLAGRLARSLRSQPPPGEGISGGEGTAGLPEAGLNEAAAAPFIWTSSFLESEPDGEADAEAADDAAADAEEEDAWWSRATRSLTPGADYIWRPEPDWAGPDAAGSGPELPQEPAEENLLRKALEESPLEHEPAEIQAIRAAVLGDSPDGLTGHEAEDVPAGRKIRWAPRSTLEKILVVEGILVAVALLAAIIVFILTVMNRPDSEFAPRQLPGGVPHPTGITLPGDLYFELSKSTIVDGQWRPRGGEWLEGTELRRIVALPWNPQAADVLESFQAGAPVRLHFSNAEELTFQVEQVDRMAAVDDLIFQDRKLSLVIVLFQERSSERWVITCLP